MRWLSLLLRRVCVASGCYHTVGMPRVLYWAQKKEIPTNSCQYTHPVQQFHFPDVLRRHASSGRWLSVDGDNVVLHMSNKSCWEAPGFAN